MIIDRLYVNAIGIEVQTKKKETNNSETGNETSECELSSTRLPTSSASSTESINNLSAKSISTGDIQIKCGKNKKFVQRVHLVNQVKHPGLPLHELVLLRQWGAADARCKQFPKEADAVDIHRNKKGVVIFRKLPIHSALMYNAPGGFIMNLLHSYPKCAQEKDEKGRLPLHCAISQARSVDLIMAIIKLYPDAVEIADSKGMLPLHKAMTVFECGSKDKVVDVLISEYPDAMNKSDNYGRLPSDYTVKVSDRIKKRRGYQF